MLSDVRDFVTAIFAELGSGTCGSVAAGLAIASPFVQPDRAQTMFFAGSAAACSAMGFLLWRRERFRTAAAVRERNRQSMRGSRTAGHE